jgi:hypothetical protein
MTLTMKVLFKQGIRNFKYQEIKIRKLRPGNKEQEISRIKIGYENRQQGLRP